MHKILHKTIFGGDITEGYPQKLLSINRVDYVEKVGKNTDMKTHNHRGKQDCVEKIVKNDKFSQEVSFCTGWK